MVDNILHDSTIAELRVHKYNETAEFLEIIRKWWSIMNTKSLFKDRAKLDKWCAPFSSSSDDRVAFLKQFINWLVIWNENSEMKGLTKDTYKAIKQTTSCILKIIEIYLNTSKFNVQYILPGKFQTDALESRFSRYRRVGDDYLISWTQARESETKIRILNIFSQSTSSQDYKLLANEDLSLTFDRTAYLRKYFHRTIIYEMLK